MIAEVNFSCGRNFLEVAGITLAVEGDACRDSLPEECLEPIPTEELAQASIGGKPASDMPIDMVRFFRGEQWTKRMLEYVADEINNYGAATF